MRYSVWNPQARAFDYYDGPGQLEGGVFAPAPKLAWGAGRNLGMAPEDAARRLPAGARKVGSGPVAQGVVAARNGLGFVGFEGGTLLRLALLGGAAYLLWTRVLNEGHKSTVRRHLR